MAVARSRLQAGTNERYSFRMGSEKRPLEPSMMDRFAEAGGPVEYDGSLVYPSYSLPVEQGDVVRIDWLSSASPRLQGLVLRLRLPGRAGKKGEGGLLRYRETNAPGIALWFDTAGPTCDLECVQAREGAMLRVNNAWQLPDGRVGERINNFGIKAEQIAPNAVALSCSDGHRARPSFKDLVVRITRLPHRSSDVGSADTMRGGTDQA
jgi:hypothetical protein